MNRCDAYKFGHHSMYPQGMTHLQSNWTARGSRVPGVTHTIAFGLQAYLNELTTIFFPMSQIAEERAPGAFDFLIKGHQRTVVSVLGKEIPLDHWRALKDLGYLPLRFSALPEGTRVPLRVPHFLVENTFPGFGWLVNYLESFQSCQVWQPSTSATLAVRFREMLDRFAHETSDTPEFVDWQGHDFSFRGMAGLEAAAASGAGHLLAFAGSDTIPAMEWINHHYQDVEAGEHAFIGGSVPASEHSVACAFETLPEGEIGYLKRLLAVNPTGIVSAVSDTWDLWRLITVYLPAIKDLIMGRDGKLVIRPDSGDPVKILCGDSEAEGPAKAGVIQLLWEIFGGTVNSKGYKVLDPHIGAIYGDAITYDRAEQICSIMKAKGFATTNFVLGIGSFTYQYQTRDTFNFAMKANWAKINGTGVPLKKKPVTDSGTKFSAAGRLAAALDEQGEIMLIENATREQEERSLYRTVWEDGKFTRCQTFRDIAMGVGLRKILPQPSAV